jgi:DNA-binding NtrC family response regulator
MVRRRPFDLILVDLFMNQVTGLQILAAALGLNPETLVVVMTGNPSVGSSIEALRAGAWDYLPKPFSATHLQVLVGRASHAVLKAREAAELRQQVLRHGDAGDGSALIGISPAFRRAVELARKVAATDASVFISGESGTGKEVIAQFIHAHSRRSRKHLVPINCAALPEPLLEPEGRLHRCRPRQAWPPRDGQRQHPLSRRTHRDVTAAPGQAAPGGAGRCGPSGRRRGGGRSGRCPLHLGDQP